MTELRKNYITDATSGLTAQVSARVQTPTGNALQVQIGPGDVISNLPVTVDYDHHQIHEGEAYQYFNYTAALNGTLNLRLKTLAKTATTQTPHMIIEVISGGLNSQADIYFFEGATWTSGGTLQTVFNRNRNETTAAAAMEIYAAGGTALTVNATGTQFYQGLLLNGNKGSTGSERSLAEWVLKPSTEYLFRITTSAASATLIRVNWYEDRGV